MWLPGGALQKNKGEYFGIGLSKTINQIYIPGSLWLDLVHDGKLEKDKIINLGAILAGKAEGRKSDDEIIIYSVGGMPVEDVAWGKKCYEKALELGIGTKLNLWEKPYLA